MILKPASDDFVPADGADSATFSHRFGITITEEVHQEWQSRLKDLVDERNRLVHLSLLNWDFNTIEGCQAVVAVLDEQRGRIEAEFERVKCYYEFFTRSMKQLLEAMMDGAVTNEPGAQRSSG